MNGGLEILSLSVARYRLEWEVESRMRLPEYAGSALRGVFGAALRRVVCLTGKPECPGCGSWRSCPYPLIFETPVPVSATGERMQAVVPNPYMIEPPPWGERIYQPGESLVFHMVLVGKALAQLSLIVFAWQRALARGVGPDHGKARLLRVVHVESQGEREIFHSEGQSLLAHDSCVSVPPWPGPSTVTMQIITPARVQRDGSPLGPERITPRDLLVNLMRRVSQVMELHGQRTMEADYADLAQQARLIDARGRLTWRDWTRRSARQQQTMALGGVVGTWHLTGPLELFWPFLYLGQWLHVGKNATFGLGHYRLIEMESRS
ncbi:MAG: CRISPR system precrRNA processing endoribonuclease RAMP protein Cas6 [Magnetococcales bacterium]|nr:CRISPR system precrRNA processing endoribonuclease RAMP protein Cas6 [Magnetococcales bacterium]